MRAGKDMSLLGGNPGGNRAGAPRIILGLASLALTGCIFSTLSPFEGDKQAGGGGIETVGIRGYAYHENGLPATNARVRLRTREFLADSGIVGLKKQIAIRFGETVTDARGFYALDSVDPGEYRIEVADEADSQGAVVEAVVSGNVRVFNVEKAVVKTPGRLVGRLAQGGYYVNGAWVHVYGMQRSLTTDSYGRISFGDLPEGDYRIIIRLRRPYGHVQTLTLPAVGIEAGKVNDLGILELPGGCDGAACDSLVVRYILDRNGLDSLPVDSVALWDAANGRIEELDLSARGVTTLPYVQDLVTLKRLELDNNSLESLPLEVTRIVGLEYLSLNYNNLRTLPREIGNLKFLTWLHVYDNNLDSLPPAMGNLTSLRYVTMSYNYLRSLPVEMGRLTNLNQLFVHHNRLETLPEALLDLPKMSLLDIHSNRLCNLSARWQAFLDKGSSYDWRAYQTCSP